jgi:hypothetical protein
MDRPEMSIGCNKEVVKAQLFALLQASIVIRDQVEDMISDGVQRLIILIDSRATLNADLAYRTGPWPNMGFDDHKKYRRHM